jgi:hypothetical protein
MLLIAYVLPASGIIISENEFVIIQDPIKNYRLKLKNFNEDRTTPTPGDLIDGFEFPEINNNSINILTSPKIPIESFDDTIIEILNQIDESMVLEYLEDLTAFGPKVTGTTECAAAGDYIYNEFENIGIDARYHHWSNSGYTDRNIEGTLEGIDNQSDEIYIICAHYDSVPGSPGADDDGSGTAAVLAAANIMSQYQFNHTIRFVAFSGEEQGLLGSHEYVEEAAANGDNIIAALNADMIGYAISKYDGDNIKIFENDESEWITDFSISVSEEYYDYIELTIIPSGYSYGSDHYSFWQFYYDAIFYHEYHFNPHWHSPQDTIENMNITYSTKSTKLIIATLGELADVYFIGNPPDTPEAPDGPMEGSEGEELTFSASTTDPDGDMIYYKFNWGNGSYSSWLGPLNSGETIETSNIWNEEGVYEVRVKAKDINNRLSDWSEPLEVTINENLPPEGLTINGPKIGRTGKSLTFSLTASDPEEHDVFYFIMWGDGTHNDWSGPYKSGDEVKINHTYTKGGQMFINLNVKDQYNKEGEPAQFVLFIIKDRSTTNQILLRFIERVIKYFPSLEFLLSKLFII